MRKLIKCVGVAAGLFVGSITVAYTQNNKVVIEMTNTATYQPAEIVVSKGEKITWKNTSGQLQTITVKTEQNNEKRIACYPDEAEPFSSGAIQPGESFSYTFFIPGAYQFVSLPNEKLGMEGRIIVKD